MDDINSSLKEQGLRIVSDLVGGGKVLKIYHNNVLCKIAPIDGYAAKTVAAYQGMLNDAYKVMAYTQLGGKMIHEKFKTDLPVNEFDFSDEGHVICSSLYFSAVALYGKCFTDPKGRLVKIERDQVFKRMSDEQKEAHDRMLSLRHNWIAHGGHSNHESVCAVVAFLPTDVAIPLYPALGIGFSSSNSFEEISALCQILIDEIELQKSKHVANVFKGTDILAHLHELRESAGYFLHIEDQKPRPKPKQKPKQEQEEQKSKP